MAKKKIDRSKLLGIKKELPKKITPEPKISDPTPILKMPEEKLESAVEKIHQPVAQISKKTSKPVRLGLWGLISRWGLAVCLWGGALKSTALSLQVKPR